MSTSLLSNNDFKVAYSSNRTNHFSACVDPYWLDANVCIDVIRNTLFEAGWQFVNPYKVGSDLGGPMQLGLAALENNYVAGQGYMDFRIPDLASMPHMEDGSNNIIYLMRVLIRNGNRSLYQIPRGPSDPMIGGVPYPGPGIRTAVTLVGGIDMDLSAGTVLNQVRGLAAYKEGALTVGSFDGSQFFWFYDRVGNNTVIGTGPAPDPGATRAGPNGPTNFPIIGGPISFVTAVNDILRTSWAFRKESPGLDGPGTYPGTDLFTQLDWTVTLGRDSGSGLINFTDDMSGTQGNNPVIFFQFTTSPYYNGVWPSNSANGGGWVMTSPQGEITVAIVQSRTSANHIEFIFADSTSSISYHSFFHGRIHGAVSYDLHGGPADRRSPPNLPEYRIIASALGFAVVDVNNTPDQSFNSLLAFIPQLTQDQRDNGALRSLFIAGPVNLKLGMMWDWTCSLSNDGLPFSTFMGTNTSRPGMVATQFRFNFPLQTSQGRTFLQNAWVMASTENGVDAKILGRVPDALVLSGSITPLGSRFTFEGHTFVCVCSQGVDYQEQIPVCSLWLAAD